MIAALAQPTPLTAAFASAMRAVQSPATRALLIVAAVALLAAVVAVKRHLGMPPVAALGVSGEARMIDEAVLAVAAAWVLVTLHAARTRVAHAVKRA